MERWLARRFLVLELGCVGIWNDLSKIAVNPENNRWSLPLFTHLHVCTNILFILFRCKRFPWKAAPDSHQRPEDWIIRHKSSQNQIYRQVFTYKEFILPFSKLIQTQTNRAQLHLNESQWGLATFVDFCNSFLICWTLDLELTRWQERFSPLGRSMMWQHEAWTQS